MYGRVKFEKLVRRVREGQMGGGREIQLGVRCRVLTGGNKGGRDGFSLDECVHVREGLMTVLICKLFYYEAKPHNKIICKYY